MKSFRPFGPILGKGKLSKKIIEIINNQIDKSIINKYFKDKNFIVEKNSSYYLSN